MNFQPNSQPNSQPRPAPIASHATPLPHPNFDPIAPAYRWLEYLTLGRSLERCRDLYLPLLLDRRHALVLGDGDGRFLSRLLFANAALHADAVDLSPRMLALLHARCQTVAPGRLRLLHANALSVTPELSSRYDLVVTHFFLDCLTDPQLLAFSQSLAPRLGPDAIWLLSEFRIPPRGLARLVGRLAVRLLYLAFRLLTGLQPTRLPDHAAALTAIGFDRTHQSLSLCGLLTTELWQTKRRPDRIQSRMSEDPIPPTTPSDPDNIPANSGNASPSHHHVDHIDTLYGSDPLTYIATPPVLIEDLFATPEDPLPDPEPPSPSLSEPDPEVPSNKHG